MIMATALANLLNAPNSILMNNFIQNRIQQLAIQYRVIGIVLLTLSLVLGLFSLYSYYSIPSQVTEEVNQIGDAIGMTLAESARLAFVEGNFDELHQTLEDLVQNDKNIIRIDIEDVKKDVILSKNTTAVLSDDRRQFVFPVVKKAFTFEPLSNELKSQIVPEKKTDQSMQAESTLGYIQLTYSPDAILTNYTHRAMTRFYVLLLCALVSLILPVWLSRSVAVPIKKALKALKTIRDGKYNLQVEVTTKGEIGDLQETINQITHNMDESIIELENKVTARTIELQNSRDAIIKSDSEKRRLIQKVHSIVEDERKSIAAEIHDELNATLIAAKLSSQSILNLATAEDIASRANEIKVHAQNIIQLTTDLYASARNIVRRLRPEILDMLGLEGAINDIIENYNSMHPQCHLSFSSQGDLTSIPNDLDITIYRLVQEALSNVLKHAEATEAEVVVRNDEENKQLLVSVKDNGKGFSPKINEIGIGIIGMKERAYAFHGDIEIVSGEVGGTTVKVIFPLSAKEPE